ncbi:MAG: phage tail protein [Verrucomicrobiae bacterium]|nr:phage tail protein [Verrucomicrobiae bacterium]
MATELGQAYVQIMPSAKGIGKNLEKTMNGEASSAGASVGKTMGGSLVSTLGKVIVAAGIGKMISGALNVGGELQQNLGGTEAVFGDFAGNIQSTAKDAYKNMGLSASDYMATANKMGSLFQGSGVDQQKSLDMTSEAMQRAADVASVMGLDTSAAMESIAGAAKGNFTMMDNLGVAMNATTLEAYALEKGMNFDWNTASQAEKSELAMKMFMDRTSQYAGNFAKESSETFSGSLGAMKSSFTDLMGSLATGEDIGPALKNVGDTVLTFAKNLIPMLTDILTQLPTIIVELFSATGPELLAAGIQAIGDIAMGIGQALPTLIPTLMTTLLTIVQTFIDNIPMLIESGMQLLTGLAQGLIAAIPLLLEKGPEIINSLITALTEQIPVIIDTGITLLLSLIDALPQIISTLMEAMPVIIDNLIVALTDMLPYIVQTGIELLIALVDALPLIMTTIARAMPKIVDSIVNTLLNNIGLIIDAGFQLLTALIDNLPAIISTLVGSMPEIITSLITALGKGITGFKDIGKQLLLGLADGISGAVGAVVKKAKEAAAKIVKSVKNFFGIKSPSRVFAGIGGQNMAGLAKGITDNVKPVTKAMDEVGAMTTKSFESELAFNATASTGSAMAGLNASLNSGIRTQGNDNQSRMEELLALSVGVMNKYLPQMANMQVVLDTGELVGVMSDEMDFATQRKLGGVGVV